MKAPQEALPKIPENLQEKLEQNLQKLHPEYPKKVIERLAKAYSKQTKLTREKAETVLAGGVDRLTGLVSRNVMDRIMNREIQRANRAQTDISLILLDLDHFKKVNDTLGHRAGDIALKELGKIIRAELREIDIPIRYGGEEFIAVLPQTGIHQAAAVAERLRISIEKELKNRIKEAVEADPFLSVEPEKIDEAVAGTASFGVSGYEGKDQIADTSIIKGDLVGKADVALYASKGKAVDKFGQMKEDPSMGKRNSVFFISPETNKPVWFTEDNLSNIIEEI